MDRWMHFCPEQVWHLENRSKRIWALSQTFLLLSFLVVQKCKYNVSVCLCLFVSAFVWYWLFGLVDTHVFVICLLTDSLFVSSVSPALCSPSCQLAVAGDICGADFAGSNDSMEMYPAILMHILVWNLGKPLWNKEYWISISNTLVAKLDTR